jgi:hypothetical protein
VSADNLNSEVFDHDAGSARHRYRLDPGHDPGLCTNPSKVMPVGGAASPLLVRHRQHPVERIATNVQDVCCHLPSRWLSQLRFLKEII